MRHTMTALALVLSLTGCAREIRTEEGTSERDQPGPAAGEPAAEIDKAIWVIFQGSDGSHWFGSNGQGVYRFDGETLVRFTTAHGLGGNHIRSIQEDRSGNIYVSSDPGGVSRFDGRTFTPLSVAHATASEWRLGADDLWFPGGQDSGVVYRYDIDGRLLHRLAFPETAAGKAHMTQYPRTQYPAMKYSPYDVYTVFKDSRGHVWFGTALLGAVRFDGNSFAWAAKTEIGFGANDSFGVRSIVEDKDGRFFFSNTEHRHAVEAGAGASSTSGTVALSHRKEPGIADPNDAAIPFIIFMSAVKDPNGDLWLATLGGGVFRYDGNRVVHYPVTHNGAPITVHSIYRDRRDVLWLGTHEHGAYKWNGAAFEKVSL